MGNCDETLPKCAYANYTHFEPLYTYEFDDDVKPCTNDKTQANWITDLLVLRECSCWSNQLNITQCTAKICDEDGIYEVVFDDVNTSLPSNKWCNLDISDANFTDSDSVDILYLAGCDEEKEQWVDIFCPDQDKCYILDYFLALSVSMLCMAFII